MVGQWIKKITPTLAKNLKAGRYGQFCLRVTAHLTLRSDLTLSMGPYGTNKFYWNSENICYISHEHCQVCLYGKSDTYTDTQMCERLSLVFM